MTWLLIVALILVLGIIVYNSSNQNNHNNINDDFSQSMRSYLDAHTVRMLPGRDLLNVNHRYGDIAKEKREQKKDNKIDK